MDDVRDDQQSASAKMTASQDPIRSSLGSPLAAVLIAFIVLGVLARMIGLSINSYWLDELASIVNFADPTVPFARMITEIWPSDNSPPLYYLTLYFWSTLFGQSEPATRSLSVVYGIAAVCSPFVLHGAAGPLRRKLLLSALIACSYGAVFYSQEVRAYSLLILLSSLTTFTFVNIDTALARSEGIAAAERLWLFVLSLLLAYTHYFGFLLVCSLYALLGARALLTRNMAEFWRTIGSGSAVVLLFAPWPFLAFQLQDSFVSAFENDPVFIAKQVATFGYYLTGSPVGTLICGLLTVGYAGITLVYFLRLRRRPAAPSFHILSRCQNIPIYIFVMIIASSIIVSMTVAPIVSYRNFLVALPAFLLYVAYSLEFSLRLSPLLRRHRIPSLAVLLGVLLFGSLYDHYQPYKEDWRQSAAYIESFDRCSTGEIVVIGQRERWQGLYEFYLTSPGLRVTTIVFDPAGQVVTSGARETLRRIWQQPCPVKIWAAHARQEKLETVLRELEAPPDVRVTPFNKVFVVERQAAT